MSADIRALAAIVDGDYAAAEPAAAEGIELYRQSPFVTNVGYVMNVRAVALLGAERVADAIAQLEEGLAMATEYRDDRLEGFCATNLTWALLHSGDAGGAAAGRRARRRPARVTGRHDRGQPARAGRGDPRARGRRSGRGARRARARRGARGRQPRHPHPERGVPRRRRRHRRRPSAHAHGPHHPARQYPRRASLCSPGFRQPPLPSEPNAQKCRIVSQLRTL